MNICSSFLSTFVKFENILMIHSSYDHSFICQKGIFNSIFCISKEISVTDVLMSDIMTIIDLCQSRYIIFMVLRDPNFNSSKYISNNVF